MVVVMITVVATVTKHMAIAFGITVRHGWSIGDKCGTGGGTLC